MNSDNGKEQKESNAREIDRMIINKDSLLSIDYESIFDSFHNVDEFSIRNLFSFKMEQYKSLDLNKYNALQILSEIFTIHLSPQDPSGPWKPAWDSEEKRTSIASDYCGAQNDIFAEIIPQINFPPLRARLSDICWYNDKSKYQMADVAIHSYCEIIEGRISGKYKSQFFEQIDFFMDTETWLMRAIDIAKKSKGRKNIPQNIKDTFNRLYTKAQKENLYVLYCKIAELGLANSLIDASKLASEAEAFVEVHKDAPPHAIKPIWYVAANAYERIGDLAAKRRCLEGSVGETLRMREQVSGASAKAFWTRRAIGELRFIGNLQDRVAELRRELTDFEDASLDEVTPFSIPMDLTKMKAGTVKIFENLTLPEIFINLSCLSNSPTINSLRENFEKHRTGLSSLFGTTYSDREGKTIAVTQPPPSTGDIEDDALKDYSRLFMEIHRRCVVQGMIEPARESISFRFSLEHRHFLPITRLSLFVPQGYEYIFALGFARLWQGDFASASYLLIPQLENSLRHVLKNSSIISSKISPNLLQEDRSLSGLLESLREHLEEIFTKDIIYEIDLLFNHKIGPALRHAMAHGKISSGDAYSDDCVYACWFIYRLTCLPLISVWKSHVAPQIEDLSF
ncbi:hypothetical protein GFGA_1c0914 [Gluconobacter frateurii NBRC 103465]|nr:hypothetical protein GFGA_1c0914 [Gluconobacter frateurii NBRC 103465]